MQVKRIVVLLVLAAVLSCREEKKTDENPEINEPRREASSPFSKVAGTYVHDGCRIQIEITTEGEYRIGGEAPEKKGRVALADKHVNLGDLSLMIFDEALVLQNTGNAMNEYVHFPDCDEKYVELIRK